MSLLITIIIKRNNDMFVPLYYIYVTWVLHISSRTSTGCILGMGTRWVWYRYIQGTSRGVSNYFNQFDTPIRSPIRLDTTGCGSGMAGYDQTKKNQKVKCMSEIYTQKMSYTINILDPYTSLVLVMIDIYILYLFFLFLCIVYLFLFKNIIYYCIFILKILKLTYHRIHTVPDMILVSVLVQHRPTSIPSIT
jgi:hypothetical protein